MLLEAFKSKTIMLVVAHPDDEVLGTGATMHRLIKEFKSRVHIVILGEGITSRSDQRSVEQWEDELKVHRKNIDKAAKFIGFKSVSTYNFPDNRFDSIDLLDIIKTIEIEKRDFKPDVIFTHHGGDVNIDHQRTFQAVITACRPMSNESVKTIICFETMSGTEWRSSSDPFHFIPNFFVEVGEDNIQAKINAMNCYEFERRTYPHPRSPKALRIRAQMWGVANGVELAEAFQVVRSIEKI
jgi:LmbE family N-acetylglucosaminyl deacetylase